MADINQKSDLRLLLTEIFKRVNQTSPKFFRVLKKINGLLSLVTGIPVLLTQAGIILPPKWATVLLSIVSVASLYGAAMNALPVAEPNPTIMPFTEKKEAQEEVKQAEKQTPTV